MTANIHPSAIVHENAKIADCAKIGPFCVIGEDVTIEEKVHLHSHVVVDGLTSIGAGTQIYPFASIGTPPQDKKFGGEKAELIIGKNNVIREHVTMNPGTQGGGMKTIVGNDGLFMVGAHIAHDCIVGNNVIMANNATIAGHVHVGDFAVLGGLCAVHQFIRIGAYAVIGGMSGVESDVIPYGRVKGERAFLAGLNLIGLERQGFAKDDVKKLQRVYRQLFSDEKTFEERLAEIEDKHAGDELIAMITKFARGKERFPLCQPSKK